MRFLLVKVFGLRARRRCAEILAVSVAALLVGQPDTSLATADAPFWEVASITGETLGCLVGAPSDRVALFACQDACAPIPWQLDERDAQGRLALDQGPAPSADDPPGVIDGNDEVRWMAADSGRPMRRDEAPPDARCGVELALRHTEDAAGGWAYAFVLPSTAPRSPTRYVRYDPDRDVISGTRVSLGFRGATPQYLGLRSGEDGVERSVLDRLKVRAFARFLGLIPMRRNEDDLESGFVAWRAGPIRVIRRQRQRIRLGWGIRSPAFGTDTSFYRDFAELPVTLRLNFPPTYFFGGIEIRAALDFRDLRGWQLLAPGLREPLVVGSMRPQDVERLNALPGDWFALIGSNVQLVQVLGSSPSLATVDRRLFYREQTAPDRPEAERGEMPGVGHRLTRWEHVGSGAHWFSATCYALPAEYDLQQFLRERARPVTIEALPFPAPNGATLSSDGQDSSGTAGTPRE